MATNEYNLFWDSFGDVRCIHCLDLEAEGFEVIPAPDLKIMGELVEAFGRDFSCECGKVVWNPRAQKLEPATP